MPDIRTNTVLSVNNLTKTYKTFRKEAGFLGTLKSFVHRNTINVEAVKATSFEITKGEFVGLLGPNGAGKTTILKMLTGLIPPTHGSAVAFQEYNTSLRLKPYLRKIGMVMGQRNQLHPDLPAMESFRLSQAIYGISDKNFQARLSHCLDIFEIHSKVDIPVRKLSLGERMKLELILAILHEPELLFLDEPTIGLDFNAATQIRKFLKEANKTLGITIVLTSHYTKDIEELCRRVIVINHGSLVYDGSLEGLDERIKGERILCLTTTSEASYKKIHAWSQEHPRTKFLPLDHDNPAEIRLSVPTDIATSVLTSLCASIDPHDLSDLVIEERSLEDVFAEIFARPSNRTVQKV